MIQRLLQPMMILAVALFVGGCGAPATEAPATKIAPINVTFNPDPGPKGDPDGSGSAIITLDREKGEICFELSVSGITLPARAAHIHEGSVGENGPIVVGLAPPDAGGIAKGCRSVESEKLNAIMQTPSNYHILVHTDESGLTKGALRGQLP